MERTEVPHFLGFQNEFMMFCYGQSAKSKMTRYSCEVPKFFGAKKSTCWFRIFGEVGDLFISQKISFQNEWSCTFDKAC